MDIATLSGSIPSLVNPPADPSVIFQNTFNSVMVVIHPPPEPTLDIYHRVSEGRNEMWHGRDVFLIFSNHRYAFYRSCGETPETILQMLGTVGPRIHESRTGRPHRLSPINRLLLVLLWLRSYPCYNLLSLLFDVSSHTVSMHIRALIPILWEIYSPNIAWPSRQQWLQLHGNWSNIPTALAAIDGTSHAIYRPQVEPQEEYYSGHRHVHCIHTQIVVDNENHIRLVKSGFLGHQNDAQQFNLLPSIGTNLELDFPPNYVILADKIYADRAPIVTPYRRHQLRRKTPREKRKCKKFNRRMSTCRVYVEHAIRRLKTFRVVGTLWRHRRNELNQIVELCAGLVERQHDLFSY